MNLRLELYCRFLFHRICGKRFFSDLFLTYNHAGANTHSRMFYPVSYLRCARQSGNSDIKCFRGTAWAHQALADNGAGSHIRQGVYLLSEYHYKD